MLKFSTPAPNKIKERLKLEAFNMTKKGLFLPEMDVKKYNSIINEK